MRYFLYVYVMRYFPKFEFSGISSLDLLPFFKLALNFERRFSNLQAVLYMTMAAASRKSACEILEYKL
jgi:hypothetical protein